MLMQIISLAGAACVLLAYVGLQWKWFRLDGYRYNLINLIGAGLLGSVAVAQRSWGFIVLQIAWGLISLPALTRRAIARNTVA